MLQSLVSAEGSAENINTGGTAVSRLGIATLTQRDLEIMLGGGKRSREGGIVITDILNCFICRATSVDN
jgi:hypothetical protein